MSNYNFLALEKNLTDVIKESQIKIGYTDNPIELYYPLQALNNLLGADFNELQMSEILQQFSAWDKNRLGEISSHINDGIFCIKISAKGVKYVYEKVENPPFLCDFINLVRNCHNGNIDIVLQLFKKYSEKVVCSKFTDNDEFDYLIYFEDGMPDDYRYCISFDLGHIIYHRFTPEDFKNLF